jgi:hypothetical protein
VLLACFGRLGEAYISSVGLRTRLRTVRHEWLKRKRRVGGLVCSWEGDAFGRGRPSPSDLDVEAVGVELDAGESGGLEILHVAVEGDKLSSQDVSPRLDIAWNLNSVAVGIIGGPFIAPFVYIVSTCYSSSAELSRNRQN